MAIPYWGSRIELLEVSALARERRIKPHIEYYPLDQAMEAYRRMRAGQLQGRAVILPND